MFSRKSKNLKRKWFDLAMNLINLKNDLNRVRNDLVYVHNVPIGERNFHTCPNCRQIKSPAQRRDHERLHERQIQLERQMVPLTEQMAQVEQALAD